MKEIYAKIHETTGVPYHVIADVVTSLKSVIKEELVSGRDVDLGRDFGKFVSIEIPGRERYIPSVGERRHVEGSRRLRFRPSSSELKKLPLKSEDA